MRSFFIALLLASCLSAAAAVSTHVKRDVCDIQNNSPASDACSMQKAFGGSSIFPQLLPQFSPQAALYVTYRTITVGGAQQLAPNRVSFKPSLSISFIQGPSSPVGARLLSGKFALICLDYQPQGRVTRAIWIESGLRVNRNNRILSGTAAPIKAYQPPNPPRGTGTHSYVFLVIEETGAGLAGFLQRNPNWKNQLMNRPFDLKAFLAQSKFQNSLVASSFFKSTHV